MRLYELAKELGVKSKDLVEFANEELKLDIAGHLVTLDEDTESLIRDSYVNRGNDLESEDELGSTESDDEVSSIDYEDVVGSIEDDELGSTESEDELGFTESEDEVGSIESEDLGFTESDDLGFTESEDEVGSIESEDEVGFTESEGLGSIESEDEVGSIESEDLGVTESKDEVGSIESEDEVVDLTKDSVVKQELNKEEELVIDNNDTYIEDGFSGATLESVIRGSQGITKDDLESSNTYDELDDYDFEDVLDYDSEDTLVYHVETLGLDDIDGIDVEGFDETYDETLDDLEQGVLDVDMYDDLAYDDLGDELVDDGIEEFEDEFEDALVEDEFEDSEFDDELVEDELVDEVVNPTKRKQTRTTGKKVVSKKPTKKPTKKASRPTSRNKIGLFGGGHSKGDEGSKGKKPDDKGAFVYEQAPSKKVKGSKSRAEVRGINRNNLINVIVAFITIALVSTVFVYILNRSGANVVNYESINNVSTMEELARESFGDSYVNKIRSKPISFFETDHTRVMKKYIDALRPYLDNPTDRKTLDVATVEFFTNLEYIQQKALEKEAGLRTSGQSNEMSQIFAQNHEFIMTQIQGDIKSYATRLLNGYDASNIEQLKDSMGVSSNEEFVVYMKDLLDTMFYTYYNYVISTPQTRLGVATEDSSSKTESIIPEDTTTTDTVE